MKHFLYSVLKFSIVCFIGYYFLIIIWGSFVPQNLSRNLDYLLGTDDFMYTKAREIKNVENVDVLVVGSSHAYQSFDPRIFKKHGITMFNLGSNVQAPIQTKMLLKRYMDRLTPKSIIYEVYPVIFGWDGFESALGLISNVTNDLYSIEMAFEMDHMKIYNTLLYAIFRDILNLDHSFDDDHLNRKYISGGYVEKEMRHFDYIDHPRKQYEFNEAQLTAFKKIIGMVRQRNIRLILVFAPITSSLYNSYVNNEEFDRMMLSYGEYYNFNKWNTLDDSLHFDDDDHLNQRGVELFNEQLLTTIHKKLSPVFHEPN